MLSRSQRFGHMLRGVGQGFRLSFGLALLLFTGVATRADSPPAIDPTGADNPQALTLTGMEFMIMPNVVTLTVGQPVQLTLINGGAVDHDLKSSMPIADLTYQNADNPADEQQDNSANGVLDVDYNVGTTAQVSFTPTQEGTYAFQCDVPGHAQLGMTGTFVVQPAP